MPFLSHFRRTRKPEEAPELRDVFIAARMAQIHAAGTHTILSTILTELAKLRAIVEEVRDRDAPIRVTATVVDEHPAEVTG